MSALESPAPTLGTTGMGALPSIKQAGSVAAAYSENGQRRKLSRRVSRLSGSNAQPHNLRSPRLDPVQRVRQTLQCCCHLRPIAAAIVRRCLWRSNADMVQRCRNEPVTALQHYPAVIDQWLCRVLAAALPSAFWAASWPCMRWSLLWDRPACSRVNSPALNIRGAIWGRQSVLAGYSRTK